MLGLLLAAAVAASNPTSARATSDSAPADVRALATAQEKLLKLRAIAKAAELNVDLSCAESAAWVMDHTDSDLIKKDAFAMETFYSGRLTIAATDIDWHEAFRLGMSALPDDMQRNADALVICLPKMAEAVPRGPK